MRAFFKNRGNDMPVRLDIKSLENGNKHKPDIMLHACFQLLKDYVEKEDPEGQQAGTRAFIKEINTLYRWWTVRRPKRKDPMADKLFWKFISAKNNGSIQYKRLVEKYEKMLSKQQNAEEKWANEDNEYLDRLIAIREELWV